MVVGIKEKEKEKSKSNNLMSKPQPLDLGTKCIKVTTNTTC